MLVVHDQVVEHPHHRSSREDRRFLLDRQPSRAVGVIGLQDAALLLREGRAAGRNPDGQYARRHCGTSIVLHLPLPLTHYLSSQTSSMRLPLWMLSTMISAPFTQGRQQVPPRL